jgi:hypothetical protein
METETIFVEGIIFKLPREGAPEYVKGTLSFNVEEAVAFLEKNVKNGWVNVDIKKSRAGKYYLALNTFVPKSAEERGL